ncbi:4-hydroxy-3-methylbut-2-enyl diphosphate reductase [bacterium]
MRKLIICDGKNVLLANYAGLCFGVRRAIKKAIDASKNSPKPVYTLGPIIHNPQVVNLLESKGVKSIDNIDDIEKGTVIIRSHGVPKDIFEQIQKKNITLIDATCPFVKKAQKIVSDLSKEDKNILIVGNKEHPEVIGLISFSSSKIHVVNSLAELENIKELSSEINIVCQTTQPIEKLEKIRNYLVKKKIKVEIFNTICDATVQRQKEAEEIAKMVDLVLVLGGYNSANTKRLYEICKENQTNTFHLETEKEIDKNILKSVNTIGIVTGASTPSWIIRRVVTELRRICNGRK